MLYFAERFLRMTTGDTTVSYPVTKLNTLMVFAFAGLMGIVVGYMSVVYPVNTVHLIALFGLLVSILFALRLPFYGFLILILTLPFEAAFVLEIGFTIRPSYLVVLGLTFVILCQFALRGRFGDFSSPLNIPILLYLGVTSLSLIMTILNPPPAVDMAPEAKLRGSEFRSMVQLAFLFFSSLAYFYTVYFCSNDSRIVRALRTYVYCAIALSIYGIYQFVAFILNLPFVDITNALSTGGDVYHASRYGAWYDFRSHGTFQEPLNFGHYLVTAIPIVFALALCRKKVGDKVSSAVLRTYSLPILVMCSALFLTRSRGAWLGLLAGIVVLLMLVRQKVQLRFFSITTLTIVTLHLMMILFIPQIYDRLWEAVFFRFSEGQMSYEPRFHFFAFTMGLFREHPILGVGIGNYPLYQAVARGINVPGTAFGLPWQALVETGILGFLSLCLLVLRFYQVVLRSLSEAKGSPWYPYLVGYLASFTALIIPYFFFGDRLNLYVWVLMGLSMSTVKIIEGKKVSELVVRRTI